MNPFNAWAEVDNLQEATSFEVDVRRVSEDDGVLSNELHG